MNRTLYTIIATVAFSLSLAAQPQQGFETIDSAYNQLLRSKDIKVLLSSWSRSMKQLHFKYTMPDNGQPIRQADIERLATAFQQSAPGSVAAYSYNHEAGNQPFYSIDYWRADDYFSNGAEGYYALGENDNLRIVNKMVNGQLVSYGMIWHETAFSDRHGQPFRTIDGCIFKFYDGIWKMKPESYLDLRTAERTNGQTNETDNATSYEVLRSQIKSLCKLFADSRKTNDEKTCDALAYFLKNLCTGFDGRLTAEQWDELEADIVATFIGNKADGEGFTERDRLVGSALGVLSHCADRPIIGRTTQYAHNDRRDLFVKPDNWRMLMQKYDFGLTPRPQVKVSLAGTTTAPTVTIRKVYPNQHRYTVDVTDGKFAYTGLFDRDQLLEIEDQQGNTVVIIADSTHTEIDLARKTLQGSSQNERFAECQRRLSALEPEMHHYAVQMLCWDKSYLSVIVDDEGYNRLADEAHDLQLRMMAENADNMIPVWYLVRNFFAMTADELRPLMQHDRPYADHVALQPVWQHYEGMQKRAVGQPFVDAEVTDTAGVAHRLSEYVTQGRYTILYFWDMNSRTDMKTLQTLQHLYKDSGLNIVCITLDGNRQSWANYVRQRRLNFTHLQPADITAKVLGREYAILKAYGITTVMPEIIVFGPDRRIVVSGLCGESLKAAVDRLYKH